MASPILSFPSPLDLDEPMALRKEDKEWIKGELALALGNLRPKGWGRLAFMVRDWIGVCAGLAVIVGITAIWRSDSTERANADAAYVEFKTHTEDRLSNIEGSLLNLEAVQHPAATLEKIGKLPPIEISSAFPAIRQIATQPMSTEKPSAETLRAVSARLSEADQSSQGYWPTVLSFISFASADFSSGVPPPGPPTSIFRNNHGFGIAIGGIKHEVVLLDGGDLGASVEFDNCRIIFTSNPVRMVGVRFVNCVFEFPASASPVPYLQNIGRQLLAAGVQSATVTTG